MCRHWPTSPSVQHALLFTATGALETSFSHWRCFQWQFWTSEVLKPSGTEGILKPSTGCVYALHDSALRPRSVSSCCQPLHGRAAVALRCSHSTITALTVDLGRWRRTEISLPCLERLQVCDLIKSLSSSLYAVLLASVFIIHLVFKATGQFWTMEICISWVFKTNARLYPRKATKVFHDPFSSCVRDANALQTQIKSCRTSGIFACPIFCPGHWVWGGFLGYDRIVQSKTRLKWLTSLSLDQQVRMDGFKGNLDVF